MRPGRHSRCGPRAVPASGRIAMRILMLGWEFPPFIAGGLGTACYGLTRALDRQGHQVFFVLPRPVDRSHASHIRLISPVARQRGMGLPGVNGAVGMAYGPLGA